MWGRSKEEYYIFTNQNTPLTYISTIEVNSYFRNKGIYKKSCKAILNFLKYDQHILISKQSEMGKKCKVFELKDGSIREEIYLKK